MLLSLCFSAKAATSRPRITVPSSFISSDSTPTAGSPASRQRSMQASVWPERISTPPSRATSGNTWPGRTKSAAPLLPLASARTVLVRSSAEMPVVSPCRTSTETVKAVPSGASLSATIGSRCRRFACSTASGAHTMPEVWRMMNAIFSGVHIEAATNRSPSFSRSSSSVTTTISPALKAATTDSTRWWLPADMTWRSGAAMRGRLVVARRSNDQRSGPGHGSQNSRRLPSRRANVALHGAQRLLDDPDSHGLDELRPLHGLGRDHGGELGGRAADHVDAENGELLAHLGQRQQLDGLRIDLVGDCRRRAGRRHQAE